jgi:ribosomal protein L31
MVLRPGRVKKLAKLPSQPINLGMVVHACHPSYTRGINRRFMVQAGLMQKFETLFEI